MTSTLTPTCSFCGLRFENRPLLDLHIREDHLERANPAVPLPGNPASSGAKAGPGMAGARQPRRMRAGRPMTALRRVAGAFRHVNAELLLASEAMLRLPGEPLRPADPPVGRDAHEAAAGHRADRAA